MHYVYFITKDLDTYFCDSLNLSHQSIEQPSKRESSELVARGLLVVVVVYITVYAGRPVQIDHRPKGISENRFCLGKVGGQDG